MISRLSSGLLRIAESASFVEVVAELVAASQQSSIFTYSSHLRKDVFPEIPALEEYFCVREKAVTPSARTMAKSIRRKLLAASVYL